MSGLVSGSFALFMLIIVTFGCARDPLNKLIDRKPDDNTVAVTIGGS